LLRYSARSRSEITRCPHARHPAKILEFLSQDARRIALQSFQSLDCAAVNG
jgi:hypothetical protein